MDNLNRLVIAVETSDHNHYHGDVREGVVDALKELVDIKEALSCVSGVPSLDMVIERYEQSQEVTRFTDIMSAIEECEFLANMDHKKFALVAAKDYMVVMPLSEVPPSMQILETINPTK